jgi:hypothetical protein
MTEIARAARSALPQFRRRQNQKVSPDRASHRIRLEWAQELLLKCPFNLICSLSGLKISLFQV